MKVAGTGSGSGGRLGPRLTFAVLVLPALVSFTLLLVLVQTSFGPLNRLDEGTAEALHAYAIERPAWVSVLQIWTNVFAPNTWRVLIGLLAIWLVCRRAPRLAAWAVTTLAAGGLLGALVKTLVARARPHLPDPVDLAPGAAFPSGHALNVTVGVGVLMFLLPPLLGPGRRVAAWTIGAIIIAGVAGTRVALGVHWVSDVVAGVLLGAVVVLATRAAFERWGGRAGRPPPSAGHPAFGAPVLPVRRRRAESAWRPRSWGRRTR